MKLFVPLKEKKGIMGFILFFVILFGIVIFGFIGAVSVGTFKMVSDIVTPVLDEVVDETFTDANASIAAKKAIDIIDIWFGALPWLLTFAYGLALVFSLVFVVSYKTHPHPAFIGLYLGFILLLIFGAIIISNAYEDIYSGSDELALQLQAQPATSYLILYSPVILTLIAFIAGIYIFTSPKEPGGVIV